MLCGCDWVTPCVGQSGILRGRLFGIAKRYLVQCSEDLEVLSVELENLDNSDRARRSQRFICERLQVRKVTG